MINAATLEAVTKEHLADMYNEAIETIWLLEQRINELTEENEAVWESYEEVSSRLFG